MQATQTLTDTVKVVEKDGTETEIQESRILGVRDGYLFIESVLDQDGGMSVVSVHTVALENLVSVDLFAGETNETEGSLNNSGLLDENWKVVLPE